MLCKFITKPGTGFADTASKEPMSACSIIIGQVHTVTSKESSGHVTRARPRVRVTIISRDNSPPHKSVICALSCGVAWI
jgi:hypothetical protein